MANCSFVRHLHVSIWAASLFLLGVLYFLWLSTDLGSVSDDLKYENGPVKNNSKIIPYSKYENGPVKNKSKIIPFVLVTCKGTANNKWLPDQIKQVRILLKSAAALTQTTLWFKIFTDSESLYEKIVEPMDSWPQEYQRRLQVDFELVRYPKVSEAMRLEFKPCSTYRLLYPDVLQGIDAAVHLDTDSIFLAPPENLLEVFDKFDESEAVAMARDESLDRLIRVPYTGRTGFNAGILMMNLTRLRNVPGGGFIKVIHEMYQEYKLRMRFGDQCLLNAFFSRNPHLLYRLSCDWNYLFFSCKNGRDTCLESLQHGASLVHGAARSLTRNFRFLGLFEAWNEYEFGTPFKALGMKIQEKMAHYALPSKKGEGCAKSIKKTSTFSKRLLLYTD